MSTGQDSHLLLRAIADELARSGVSAICTSPGSRSVPIALALTGHPDLRSYSLIDERTAGFFALGLARATGRPAVLVCTSGTAAANYLPAVIEAHEAGIPLIVMTADRPAELRDVGAGQAINQLGIYGDYVRWFQHLDPGPAGSERLRWARQLGCRAFAAACGTAGGRPGPVHINVPLREPLVPPAELPEYPDGGRTGGRPWTETVPAAGDLDALRLWLDEHAPDGGGVIVAGEGAPHTLAALATALDWPLLADPQSGLRRGPSAIAHYDLLLRSEAWSARHRPAAVLRAGSLPVSKPLRAWLGALDCPQATLPGAGGWQDPSGDCGRVLPAGAVVPTAAARHADDAAWLASWRSADLHASELVGSTLGGELSEPAAARAVAAAPGPVVVASSMPVRDCELTWPALDHPPVVYCNRGASGIDGTIATALGVAAADPTEHVTLLIGDVAFTHDLGSLAAGARLGLPLTIVLIDNAGGGIFDFLPVGAAQPSGYAEHITTDPGLDLLGLASSLGAETAEIASVDELSERISVSPVGLRVLRVATDRGANVELHRSLADAVSSAISD